MSRRQTRKREIASYLKAAKELAPFIPSLNKYKRRKKNLKPAEKAAISRAERLFAEAHADHLIPIPKKRLKDPNVKKNLFSFDTVHTIKRGKNKGKQIVRHHTFQGVQFRNTAPNANLKFFKNGMVMESNGRTWLYLPLADKSNESMEETGEKAFDIQKGQTTGFADDIEAVIRLAEKAFKNPICKGVWLWAQSGRVSEGHRTLKEFIQWLYESYTHYIDTDQWMKGIAILIADVGDYISPQQYASFGTKPKKKRRLKSDGTYY